jgi:hypothetical protein
MEINFFQTFTYGIILKFLKVLNLSANDFTPENIAKLEKTMNMPQVQEAFRSLLKTYLQIADPFLKQAMQRLVLIAQDTAQKSGQSIQTLLIDLIPLVGPILVGVNSFISAFSNATRGASSAVDVAANFFAELQKKVQPDINMPSVSVPSVSVPSVSLPLETPSIMKGGLKVKNGFLVRSKTMKRKGFMKGGGNGSNDFQKMLNKALREISATC